MKNLPDGFSSRLYAVEDQKTWRKICQNQSEAQGEESEKKNEQIHNIL